MNDEVVHIVQKLRKQFEELFTSPSVDGSVASMSSGQMLLMGFHGLFTRLDADFQAMLEATSQLQAVDVWRKVDIVKDAKAIQVRCTHWF